MSNKIIWNNLIQNIVRCIIAYPILFCVFLLTIPLNICFWAIVIFNLVKYLFEFIVTGDFYFDETLIYFIIRKEDYWYIYLLYPFFVSWFFIDGYIINIFNKTLKPIKNKTKNDKQRIY